MLIEVSKCFHRCAIRALAGCFLGLALCGAASAQNLTCPVTSNVTVTAPTTNVASTCAVVASYSLDIAGSTLYEEGPSGPSNPGATLLVYGTLSNTGTVNNVFGAVYGYYAGPSTLYNALGAVYNSGAIFGGTILNTGVIDNLSGGLIDTYVSTSGGWTGAPVQLTNAAGGVLNNEGNIIIGAAFSSTIYSLPPNGSLTNNGTIQNFSGAYLTLGSQTTTTTYGAPLYYSGTTTVTNNGTLLNYSGGNVMLGSSAAVTNNGTILNYAGAAITSSASITNSVGATLTNNGTFSNGTYANGVVTGSFTNSGTFTNSGSFSGEGSLTNYGTFNNSGSFSGGSLTNSGTFNNSGNVGITGLYNSGQITNQASGSMGIAGSSLSTSFNGGSITNNGQVDFGSDFNNFGQLTNNGTLTASGGYLAIQSGSSAMNNGSIVVNAFEGQGGIIIGPGATLTNAAGSSFQSIQGNTYVYGTMNTVPAVQLAGGGLLGTGTINGDVNNSYGFVEPGAQPANVSGMVPGTLTINGNYTQGSLGALNIELLTTYPGGFGVLDVTGLATLDGTVDFSAYPGFTPIAGEDFTFLLAGSLAGEFANVDFDGWTCPTGDVCDLVYGANSVSLDIEAAGTGGGGEGGSGGSGGSGGGGGTVGVPEPSSAALLGIGLATFVCVLVRKRAAVGR